MMELRSIIFVSLVACGPCRKMDEFPQLSDLDAAYSWVAAMGEHLTDNWNHSLRSRQAAPRGVWARVETSFDEASDFQARQPTIDPLLQ